MDKSEWNLFHYLDQHRWKWRHFSSGLSRCRTGRNTSIYPYGVRRVWDFCSHRNLWWNPRQYHLHNCSNRCGLFCWSAIFSDRGRLVPYCENIPPELVNTVVCDPSFHLDDWSVGAGYNTNDIRIPQVRFWQSLLQCSWFGWSRYCYEQHARIGCNWFPLAWLVFTCAWGRWDWIL